MEFILTLLFLLPFAVVVTEKDELVETIRGIVEEVMLDKIPHAMRLADEPEWAGKEYVMDRWGWSARQLTYLRSKNRVEYAQHGRRILYHIPSIKEYIEQGRVKPSNGPLAEEQE